MQNLSSAEELLDLLLAEAQTRCQVEPPASQPTQGFQGFQWQPPPARNDLGVNIEALTALLSHPQLAGYAQLQRPAPSSFAAPQAPSTYASAVAAPQPSAWQTNPTSSPASVMNEVAQLLALTAQQQQLQQVQEQPQQQFGAEYQLPGLPNFPGLTHWRGDPIDIRVPHPEPQPKRARGNTATSCFAQALTLEQQLQQEQQQQRSTQQVDARPADLLHRCLNDASQQALQQQEQRGWQQVHPKTPAEQHASPMAIDQIQIQQQQQQPKGHPSRPSTRDVSPPSRVVPRALGRSHEPVIPAGHESEGDLESDYEDGREGMDPREEARRRNREAQQRFRERQREAQREQETQYAAMEVRIARLRCENANLSARINLLGTVLGVRDCILETFSPYCASKGAGMVLKKSKAVVSLLEGDEHTGIGELVPELKEPLNKDAVLKTQQLQSLHTYRVHYRQWQVELKYEVERAEEIERKKGATDPVAVQRAWKAVANSFNETFKVLRYHSREDKVMFWQACLSLHPTPGDVVEEEKHYASLARAVERVLADEPVREQLPNLKVAWAEFLHEVAVLREKHEEWGRVLKGELMPAATGTAPSPAAAAAAGDGFSEIGSMHTMSNSALRCARAVSELHAVSEDMCNAIYKLSVSWFTCIGSIGCAKTNMETMPYMPNWVLMTHLMLEEAKTMGFLDGQLEGIPPEVSHAKSKDKKSTTGSSGHEGNTNTDTNTATAVGVKSADVGAVSQHQHQGQVDPIGSASGGARQPQSSPARAGSGELSTPDPSDDSRAC